MAANIQNDAALVSIRGDHTWQTARGMVTTIAFDGRPHDGDPIASESTTIVFRSIDEIDRFTEQITAVLAQARIDLDAAIAAQFSAKVDELFAPATGDGQ